jgi:hypoxanthine-DNA glycosylase
MISISFDPIVHEKSKILILGTMPGIKSLEMQQYYANERNVFWLIIFKIFNIELTTDYEERLRALSDNGIALWDTLKFCKRKGSLDSNIQNAEPTDINALLKKYRQIRTVVFNGKNAEKYYRKHNNILPEINYLSMPSTSPANARFSFEYKLNAWKAIKDLR